MAYLYETEDEARKGYEQLIEEVGMHVGHCYTHKLNVAYNADEIMVREDWSNWLDTLHRDGQVPDEAVQYWTVSDD